jgi:hypothetical protein
LKASAILVGAFFYTLFFVETGTPKKRFKKKPLVLRRVALI